MPEEAPFVAVLVTAAGKKIPGALVRQLKESGRIVIPVETKDGEQYIYQGIKLGKTLKLRKTFRVRFVPLVKDNHTGTI
jgi:protein-L-isoaspartate(D-aspartate) O-methyltransferase